LKNVVSALVFAQKSLYWD